MARRNRNVNDDVKKQALALYAANGSMMQTAQQFGLHNSTISKWLKDPEWLEVYENFRAVKQKEFTEQAWNVMDEAMVLAKRRVGRALEDEAILDDFIGIVKKNGELSTQEKKSLVSKLQAAKIESIKDIVILIGTMYDKQAIANGDANVNIGGDGFKITFDIPRPTNETKEVIEVVDGD